ncbi:hypothetical protein B0G71_6624 [Paraburkholderia sp. BL27I4N3]|uniref:hypothetical protein n=1 Tax=Paraburkholderia sp. BL27I4N3 TaxID=1938805 RepID=UPI000E25578F|nr:hypothetical protein [Paraburkholderia sp. BL27I4N3]REE23375.1 hypothetical protein B0G71_6624 [Paraburkholderia sp. BL27I4N3]
MGVRAVAAGAALAVWCMSSAATAAGYAEVWNPPEASGHVASLAKKPGAAKVKSNAGSKTASKATSKAVSKRVVAATAHADQRAAHAGVNKMAAKGATKSGTNSTHTGKTGSKAAVVAQSKKPHAQLVQTKAGQGKVVRANLVVPARQAHPQTAKVVAKTGAAKPAASHVNVPASSANVSANPADATSNPATASSGSLPPILH